MERREEWYQGNPDSYINSHRLYHKGRLVATTATPDDAVQLADILNQHATLVEQRDLLAAALELASKRLDFLTNWLENTYKAGRADVDLGRKYAQAARDARDNALATVEQGEEA